MILVGDSLGQVAARLRVRPCGSRWPRCSTTPRPSSAARSARSSSATCRSCPTPRPTRRSTTPAASSRTAGAQAVKVEGGVRSRPDHRGAGEGRASRSWATSAGRPRRSTGWAARSGSRARPRPGPRAARRRPGGPGSRRLRDRPGARARAARGGDHGAAAHPDDRHRRRRRLQRPGPGHHRPARPRRLRAAARAAVRRPARDDRSKPHAAYAADVAAGTFPAPGDASAWTTRSSTRRSAEARRIGRSPDASDRRASRSTATSRPADRSTHSRPTRMTRRPDPRRAAGGAGGRAAAGRARARRWAGSTRAIAR